MRRATVLLLFLLTACQRSERAPDGGGSSTASTSATSDCVAAAIRNFQAGMAPMEITPLGPFDTSSLRGKTFAMIQFAREGNTVSNANAKALSEALANVGAKLIMFDGEGKPDVILQGFNSAIAQDVAGIIADGFAMDLVKTGVAAAAAAKIPVLDVGAGTTTPVEPPGVVAWVAVDAARVGELQASYALAKSNCHLHTVTMPVSGAPITVNMANGAVSTIKKLCPTDCSIEQLEVDPGTFITDLAGKVKTTLQRSPDLNYWITTTDFFTPFILQGMRAVDRQLPIMGGAQGDGLADAMRGTNGLVAATLWPPSDIMGYIYADGILRAAAGVPQNQVTPVRLVDSSNWGPSADVHQQFPDLDRWRDAFKAAWGVKGNGR
jgi:ABC-type sugar transport system substrate-binding protein